ncbi:putative methyltransferase, chloroplastic [Cocos nucifera]|uniref:Putative methyltransferase, chloroplastic n=1 Tax=Cocos nucifera TaxID=13894 RepID=A0A8K0N1D9_COCNU|nr:putative methyltransferase, chloroplastic [Cocos nucifera]
MVVAHQPCIGMDLIPDAKVSTGINNLGCPVCYYPLISKSNASQTIESTARSYVECHICKKAYFSNGIYLDLTVAGGSKEYTESMPGGTELFRSQLVSFLYERGWRQNFIWGGFPGPQREFEMAKVYLTPTIGGTIVDASCGSGLFSRLFAESGMYSLVVALDFSENMLLQCDEFIKQKGISKELVAEISRVLCPGGVFVATTFVLDAIPPAVPIFRAIREVIPLLSLFYLA